MQDAGFENVVEQYFYWPIGTWAKGEYYKTIGAVFQHNLLAALEGMSLKTLGLLGWSTERIMPFLAEVEAEIMKASDARVFLPM